MEIPYKLPIHPVEIFSQGDSLDAESRVLRAQLLGTIKDLAFRLKGLGYSTDQIQSILDTKMRIHVLKDSGEILGYFPQEVSRMASGSVPQCNLNKIYEFIDRETESVRILKDMTSDSWLTMRIEP